MSELWGRGGMCWCFLFVAVRSCLEVEQCYTLVGVPGSLCFVERFVGMANGRGTIDSNKIAFFVLAHF